MHSLTVHPAPSFPSPDRVAGTLRVPEPVTATASGPCDPRSRRTRSQPLYNFQAGRRRNGCLNSFSSLPCSSRCIIQARMQPLAPSKALP